ncbi:hypothetical protein TREES_T100000905 [Tupaia chinensis]|uniref:Uncharacterized protein n=1 Tax=Tupaia chinensis TaxID=246437 RepID=L9JFG4_TUPCH|nr:hypothetical protein TREES_T100000905 [Tupaia chinensis]
METTACLLCVRLSVQEQTDVGNEASECGCASEATRVAAPGLDVLTQGWVGSRPSKEGSGPCHDDPASSSAVSIWVPGSKAGVCACPQMCPVSLKIVIGPFQNPSLHEDVTCEFDQLLPLPTAACAHAEQLKPLGHRGRRLISEVYFSVMYFNQRLQDAYGGASLVPSDRAGFETEGDTKSPHNDGADQKAQVHRALAAVCRGLGAEQAGFLGVV